MPRRSVATGVSVTSLPSISMRPEVGSISRLIMRRVVVLPQPDGPMRATIDPLATSRLSPPTASRSAPGKRLVTSA